MKKQKNLSFDISFSFTNTHDSQDSREGEGYLFNSSLPLQPSLHRQLDISCVITAESSPLDIACSRT